MVEIRENISYFGEFVDIFQDMDIIRKYREKLSYTKLENEGFKLETHKSERGVKY